MDETIKFASYLTGHDEETIKQMYRDWQSSPNVKANPLNCEVSLPSQKLKDVPFKVLIELNDNELQIMTVEEFNKMVDECDEFDGIHPYIFLGYIYKRQLISYLES